MHFYEDEPTQITLNPLIEEDTEMISDDEPPLKITPLFKMLTFLQIATLMMKL